MRVRTIAASVVLSATVGGAQAGASTVAYREVFTTEARLDLPTVGWNAHSGASAAVPTDAVVGTVPGAPNPNLPAINSNEGAGTSGRTFVAWAGNTPAQSLIVWTDEYVITEHVLTVRFWENHSNNNTPADTISTHDPFRFAARVAGQWYVTADLTSLTGNSLVTLDVAGTDGTWDEQSLDVSASAWHSITFSPGSSLSGLGPAVALPAGDITAFGLYSESFANRFRIDSFEVVVPEPGALSLLALAAGAALRRRR